MLAAWASQHWSRRLAASVIITSMCQRRLMFPLLFLLLRSAIPQSDSGQFAQTRSGDFLRSMRLSTFDAANHALQRTPRHALGLFDNVGPPTACGRGVAELGSLGLTRAQNRASSSSLFRIQPGVIRSLVAFDVDISAAVAALCAALDRAQIGGFSPRDYHVTVRQHGRKVQLQQDILCVGHAVRFRDGF